MNSRKKFSYRSRIILDIYRNMPIFLLKFQIFSGATGTLSQEPLKLFRMLNIDDLICNFSYTTLNKNIDSSVRQSIDRLLAFWGPR